MAFRGVAGQQPTKKGVRFEEPVHNKENSVKPKKSILKPSSDEGVDRISSKKPPAKSIFYSTTPMWSNDNYPTNFDA